MLQRMFRKLASRAPADVKRFVAHERILRNPYVAAKHLPLYDAPGRFVVRRVEHVEKEPVPPRELWEGYGETPEEYLSLGREHVARMLAGLRAHGAVPEKFTRVLELGCAAGRMLRFVPRPPNGEFWGVDIKAKTVEWCQQHLAPLNFAATSTYPHLPFEDNYFDLVYAGSVFTHIADLPDAWFLELRRVLRPGGYAYLTVIDAASVRKFIAEHQSTRGWWIEAMATLDQQTRFLDDPQLAMCSIEAGSWDGLPVPQVVYNLDYLQKKWGAWAKPLGVCRFAYGSQHGIIFQK